MLNMFMTPLGGLLGALGAFSAYYVTMWWSAVSKSTPRDSALELGTGFVTNFFDTLGIGSFAPTTSIFKFFKLVPDRLIPGTLNVGHTLPTIAEAFIYTAVIAVDPKTLILMIAAAVAGAYLGAGIVAAWPKRNVQIGMGSALIVAALLFAYKNLGVHPTDHPIPYLTGQLNLLYGSDAGTLDLRGGRLVIGLVGNFVLGALMTLGIGMYAPSMILVALLGMNAKSAFPIMMGSCAFLMPVSSARFVKRDAYALRPALALAVGGIPAVLIAAFIVKDLDLEYVRWLVVGVVLIASSMMLRSAAKNE
jgi:uncharacterized membrane protein YfcA